MTVGPTGALDLESLAYAKYIIVWGMNMISTNLHAWPFILEAQKKGAKVVVIDRWHAYCQASRLARPSSSLEPTARSPLA